MIGTVEPGGPGGPAGQGSGAPEARRPSDDWFPAVLRLSGQVHYRLGADGSGAERILAGTDDAGDPLLDLLLASDEGAGFRGLIPADAGPDGKPLEVERRMTRKDGSPVWIRARALPLLDAGGAIAGWVAAADDVTPLREAEERLRALRSELQQDLRRSLATIRAVLRRSARAASDAKGYAAHLEGRLDALARVQSAAMRAPGAPIDLETLLGDELHAAAARHGPVRLSGPPLRLAAPTAELLALAVHELATNAVKHGALSEPVGTIDVAWAVEDGAPARLRLLWRETTARPLPPPGPPGFGTEFLEAMLAASLSARTRIEHRCDGVRCEIVLPLPA